MTTYNVRRGGFSLVELLIVVAVILTIAAIAVPSLLRSKMSGNEAAAAGSMHTLLAALTTYSNAYSTGFPVALSNLGPGTPASATAANIIDNLLASGTKSGYRYTYVSGAPVKGAIRTFTLTANPTTAGLTGNHYFFTDQTGVIRWTTGGAATASSPPMNP